ncbi:MAG: Transcriptional regulator, LysR family protein [Labilithrix sp.]|nr:Transcriptional regulator, LysR family protein [Labilithrix sp.]
MDRDLNDARFFVDVVEHQSFSAAARAARVPVSTVSRRVARLEGRLGVALLVRTTRKLALTDAGRVYHAHAARAVAEIDTGERIAQDLQSVPKGRLRVAAPRGIAGLLWPAISEFLEQYPEVSVELDAQERRVDLVVERYDLMVCTGVLPDSSMIARKILDGAYALFASPAYIARCGRPRTLRALAEHDCVVVGERAKTVRWSLRRRGRIVDIAVRGRVRVNEMGLAHQAVLDGHGIGRLPPSMVAADLRAKRLEQLLTDVDAGPIPAWIVYPARSALSAALRALVEHLLERLPRLYAAIKRTA